MIRHTHRIGLMVAVGCVLLTSCVLDAETGPTPRDVFVKYYGAEKAEHKLADMVLNSQQNVVMVGNQRISGMDYNIWIVEADTIGNAVRSKTIDIGPLLADSLSTNDFASSIKVLDDGYLVVGSFARLVAGSARQTCIWWTRLDQNLEYALPNRPNGIDTLNAGDFFAAAGSEYNLEGMDIFQTSDDNIVIVGSTDSPEENDLTFNPQLQYFLTKKLATDPDSTIWRKSYGYPNSDDYVIAGYELSNGTIGLIGSTEQVGNGGAFGNNVGIMILNSIASSQLTDEIFGVSVDGDNSADDTPNDVIRISNGFVIVGTSESGPTTLPFIMGVRESGALIASTPIISQWDQNAIGNGVTISQTGDLIVTGAYLEFSVLDGFNGLVGEKQDEILFMRTGQTGNPKYDYENNFGTVPGDDHGEVVLTMSSGSILIGATVDFGSSQTMFSLMKLNDRGALQAQ